MGAPRAARGARAVGCVIRINPKKEVLRDGREQRSKSRGILSATSSVHPAGSGPRRRARRMVKDDRMWVPQTAAVSFKPCLLSAGNGYFRSEEHTSELQS